LSALRLAWSSPLNRTAQVVATQHDRRSQGIIFGRGDW